MQLLKSSISNALSKFPIPVRIYFPMGVGCAGLDIREQVLAFCLHRAGLKYIFIFKQNAKKLSPLLI